MDRIDKILANLGYCSRSEAAGFLRSTPVLFDGRRILKSSEKVAVHHITIGSAAPDHPDGIFIVLNKPAGYVCSHDRAEGVLVYDLLPPQWMRRNPVPSTVGRLDKDTTGVLVVTDLTNVNHALSSSRRGVGKVYEVILDKPLQDDLTGMFAAGTLVLSGETTPCRPAVLRSTGSCSAEITLTEGRYHQVKRMFHHFGYTVVRLHRSRFGDYTADGIPEGGFIEAEPPLPFK